MEGSEESRALVAQFFSKLNEEVSDLRTEAKRIWPTLDTDCSVLILGKPGISAGRVENEHYLDALSLLFDTIVIDYPSSKELIPDETDEDGQRLAQKIGVLCKHRVVKTLPGYAPVPLESWPEAMAFEASLGLKWAQFVMLQFYDYDLAKAEYPSLFAFCKLFDDILETQLRLDPVFRAHYSRAYPSENINKPPDRPRYGFWELKRLSLTPYVLVNILEISAVHGRDVLTTYADATLWRILSWAYPTDPVPELSQPIGEVELLLTLLEKATLRVPFQCEPDELLDLRNKGVSTELRKWLKRQIEAFNDLEHFDATHSVIAAFNDLTRSTTSESELLVIESTVTALTTTLGYFIADLPGALLGSVGSIPLKKATEVLLMKLQRRRLKWVYDLLRLQRPGS